MNPLFSMLTGNQAPANNQQDMMAQLKANPVGMLKNAGFNVPDEISGDPRATVMHLLQTGQVSSPAMQRIQPMMQMLMGKR